MQELRLELQVREKDFVISGEDFSLEPEWDAWDGSFQNL